MSDHLHHLVSRRHASYHRPIYHQAMVLSAVVMALTGLALVTGGCGNGGDQPDSNAGSTTGALSSNEVTSTTGLISSTEVTSANEVTSNTGAGSNSSPSTTSTTERPGGGSPDRSPPIEIIDVYRVATAAPESIELRWLDDTGAPYQQLEAARAAVEAEGRTVRLILNAGLYTPALAPAGLHIENGEELNPINLNDGAGNFHLMPNGVFLVTGADAAIMESNAFARADIQPDLAIQSGPMLTVDGTIHPAFSETSNSVFIRNAVGVTSDGSVRFVMAEEPVTLWAFASFMLDNDMANSLYLDGSSARMEVPTDGRAITENTPFAAMLVVTEPG